LSTPGLVCAEAAAAEIDSAATAAKQIPDLFMTALTGLAAEYRMITATVSPNPADIKPTFPR
jgi:hypothetical protein